MNIKFVPAGLVAFLIGFVPAAFSGKTEVTTYYPSAYGEYMNLRSAADSYFATASGNVGIGTTSPTEKLDVAGKIKASGNFVMGWERVSNTCNSATACTATCSSGKKVLGGGGYWSVSSHAYGCYPDSDNSFKCTTPANDNIVTYAICARVE